MIFVKMVRGFYLIALIVWASITDATHSEEEESRNPENKNGRFLSMFEIINFPNDACKGGSKNGTCYTSDECDNKGGKKDGDCAEGYGVCCIFDVSSCGSTARENNTYFSNPTSPSGFCGMDVCVDEGICQLRLDFVSFVITGPWSDTDTNNGAAKWIFGAPDAQATATGTAYAMAKNTQCITDRFTVTGGSGSIPVICGTNANEHLYVDVDSSSCVKLGFDLGTSSTDRSWDIHVTQYECDYNNLAPSGCHQYFFGADSGKFSSLNYQSGKGMHLANQNMNYCFRQESGKSMICYSTSDPAADFDLSMTVNANKGQVGPLKGCCNYGADGKGGGFDCIVIPEAVLTKGTAIVTGGSFCGTYGLVATDNKATGTANAAGKSVCSKRAPFMVNFKTDSYEDREKETKTTKGGKGFQLSYILS